MGSKSSSVERESSVVGADYFEDGAFSALEESKKDKTRNYSSEFYTRYSKHELLDEPVRIYVTCQNLVGWEEHVKWTVDHIQKFAPGILFLFESPPIGGLLIIVQESSEKGCYTCRNLREKKDAMIHFQSPPRSWSKQAEYCRGTALHEFFHALGFQHEHQRPDRDKYVQIDDNHNDQYCVLEGATAISPFDTHSIMLYHGMEYVKLDENDDPVYFLKGPYNQSNRRSHLSPLDRICLNYIWPPARRGIKYTPKVCTKTCLYYCGREVTYDHNYPGDAMTLFCGPDKGPNCDACRVLKNTNIPKENDEGRRVWQGSSGFFYCGENFGVKGKYHDGYCGPNNGPPCPACLHLVGIKENGIDCISMF